MRLLLALGVILALVGCQKTVKEAKAPEPPAARHG
jgi:hypothetical protein